LGRRKVKGGERSNERRLQRTEADTPLYMRIVHTATHRRFAVRVAGTVHLEPEEASAVKHSCKPGRVPGWKLDEVV
jgi:hypothetical protein